MSDTHIIIVNYNAGEWLARSIQSALKHSAGVVTVVDNNSSDNSVANTQLSLESSEVVEPLQDRLRWVENSNNVGFAAANNQVLNQLLDGDSNQLATAYAVLMNPDCELSKDSLDKIIEAFKTHPKMGLASCQILNEDGSLQATSRRRFPTPWSAMIRMFKLHRLFPNNPKFANFDYGDATPIDSNGEASISVSDVEWVEAISGAFMVARLSAIKDVGVLDEAYFMHCEDLDWCKRFANAGWQVGFVPCASVVHAKGVSTRSRPVGVLWTLHKGMNRFFDKFYKDAHSLPVRYVVKLGIAFSFIGRAILSLVRGR